MQTEEVCQNETFRLQKEYDSQNNMLLTNSDVSHSTMPQKIGRIQFDEEWMEGESIRSFITTQGSLHLIATLIVAPIVFAVLHAYANKTALYAWFCAICALTAFRWRFLKHYQKNLANADASEQIKFNLKYAWTWPVTALLWGSLVWIFFTKLPLFNQFVSWVALAGIGGFATTGYAAHVKTMRRFINTMLIVILLSMVWHYILHAQAAIDSYIYSIFPLQIVFWLLLHMIGNRFNLAHIERMQLIKGNYELIDSLKAETLRANQAVTTKNRLLASAAHDIRQPVMALEMYAAMLKSEPELVDTLTDKVCLATKSVIDMFDSLFDLSRVESSQINVNKTMIHVPELLHELDVQYRLTAQAKNLELRLRGKPFDIYTDRQLLKRILGNLVMNAIKFTDKGGVLLACRPTKQGLRFEIWDTGIGIQKSEQKAVFTEFYKVPSHSGTSDGFGLGLSIVARMCGSLDFKFSMRSRIGRGSVFSIEVPKHI